MFLANTKLLPQNLQDVGSGVTKNWPFREELIGGPHSWSYWCRFPDARRSKTWFNVLTDTVWWKTTIFFPQASQIFFATFCNQVFQDFQHDIETPFWTPFNVNPGLINPKRLFNWEGTIKKVSNHDYWGNTLMKKPWFIFIRGWH